MLFDVSLKKTTAKTKLMDLWLNVWYDIVVFYTVSPVRKMSFPKKDSNILRIDDPCGNNEIVLDRVEECRLNQ